MTFLYRFTSLFPYILLLASLLTLWRPTLFTWFSGLWITTGLGAIMLGMGLTLEISDFKRILLYPKSIWLGIFLQFTIMPGVAFVLASLFSLQPAFSAGLILVGSCPGGTASNVISYLARANVALSVTMTGFATVFAVVMTPSLTSLLVGQAVKVNTIGLFVGTLQVVIIPISLGVLLNYLFPKWIKKVNQISPLISIVFITMIVASIIGASKKDLLHSGVALFGSVVCLHLIGFVLGYIISKWLLNDEIISRTISIEVGMQNSGLAVVLGKNNFADSLVSVPGAVSSLIHSLIGSFLASYWRNKQK
ncbi:MAG: bile acid:sodium symporter family protein [Spirochaetota bacterium]